MKSNTKNAKGSGTIRKRSDGRWEARYTTGIDPKTGKQIQKSVYGKTQKEVRQKLMEVTAEIDSGTYLEQTKDTVGEWLDREGPGGRRAAGKSAVPHPGRKRKCRGSREDVF